MFSKKKEKKKFCPWVSIVDVHNLKFQESAI